MNSSFNKNITLKHLLINNEKQIGIKFYPDKLLQTVIKGLPDVKWSNEFDMAYVKNNTANLNHIFEDFKGLAWINCSHFFPGNKTKINNTPAKVNDFRIRDLPEDFRKCPEEFLQKLELRKYAINTAKTYINLFERFINHYKDKELTHINENDIRTYLQLLVQLLPLRLSI